jgi:hydrogenase maturation factor HypF (carbamoyltransferase family)
MRNRLKCRVCNGTGCGTRKESAKAYCEAILAWKQEDAIHKRQVKAVKEACKKLTKEEILAIKELGV